jgi:predicted DNA-binding transcriptional regulator AlpA
MSIEEVLRQIVREEVRAALSSHSPAAAASAEYETTEQVAKRTGLSESTLLVYRRNGEGPPFVKLGRRVVYLVADVEAWMAANRRGA